jgi:hypothetical protein
MDYGDLLVIETCFGFLATEGKTALALKSGTLVYFTPVPMPRTVRYEERKHANMAVHVLWNTWPSHVLKARVIPIRQAAEECVRRG